MLAQAAAEDGFFWTPTSARCTKTGLADLSENELEVLDDVLRDAASNAMTEEACAPWVSQNRKSAMPLPTDPEARKRIAKAVVSLMKLPANKRKALLEAAKARRKESEQRAQADAERDERADTWEKVSNLKRVWMPAGDLSEAQRLALSVEASNLPDPMVYQNLLQAKLQALVDADPQEARRALEMSQENAPEMWAIAHEHSPRQWGVQLANSDMMGQLKARANLLLPGKLARAEPQPLWEILEMLA